MTQSKVDCSLIVPVYNNAASIKPLLVSFDKLPQTLKKRLEVIFVIDGTPDKSLEEIIKHKRLYRGYTKIIELTKNYGSLTAIKAGIDQSNGKFITTKAADLQEPISLTIDMFKILIAKRADIVFGIRQSRQDPYISTVFSNLFWYLYQRIVDKNIPLGGVDVIGFNDKVKPFITNMKESRSSIIEYLFWLGFSKQFVPYHRQKRLHGKSGWTVAKKFNYVIDSVFSFTDLPIIVLFALGAISFTVAVLFGLGVLIAKSMGDIVVPGYTATITISLFFFGLNAVGLSIIGNYVWRVYENIKGRPPYIIKTIYE